MNNLIYWLPFALAVNSCGIIYLLPSLVTYNNKIRNHMCSKESSSMFGETGLKSSWLAILTVAKLGAEKSWFILRRGEGSKVYIHLNLVYDSYHGVYMQISLVDRST